MTVSLNKLLHTGHFGSLRSGITKEDIKTILGEPDDCGGVSCHYKQPSIFLYGTVEFYFGKKSPRSLFGFSWEAGIKGDFQLPSSCTIVDWIFTQAWTFAQVEDYLNDLELGGVYGEPNSEEQIPWIRLQSSIDIHFAEGRLYSVSGWL